MSVNPEDRALFENIVISLKQDDDFMDGIKEIKRSNLWLDVIIGKYFAVIVSLIVFTVAAMYQLEIIVWMSFFIIAVNIFQIIRFFFNSERNHRVFEE